jgi:hypothetical protein
MDIKKRVRAELRALIEQKKIEQEAQALLITEVGSLREEKEKLIKEIQTEKEKYQIVIDLLKQETSFLKQGKTQLVKAKEEIELTVSELEIKKQVLISNTETLKKADTEALAVVATSKEQARKSIELKEKIIQQLSEQQAKKNEADLELRFINGKILLAENNYIAYLEQIKEAKEKLEATKKEQERHAQWDEYLQNKENFLIEQYKLLGVKYVVYNSR